MDIMKRAQQTVLEMTGYLGNLIRQHIQSRQQQDLMSSLIAAEERGMQLPKKRSWRTASCYSSPATRQQPF
jgi:cytochrome P450